MQQHSIKQYPKISIVTPNYNYGHLLEQTILSVLNQGYPNMEYIIIDGGSTDNSIEVIKKYEQYLSYWVSEKDNGIYHAINKGFQKSTGDIMAYLNSDDIYLPWCFETVADIFNAFPEVLWLSTLQPGYIDYQSKSRWFGSFPGFSKACFLEGKYAGGYSKYTFIQQESTFWRKELWQQAGKIVDTNYKLAGDFYLWNEFYKYAELFGVRNPLGLFRANDQQKSDQIEDYIKECKLILNSNKSMHSAITAAASIITKIKNKQLPVVKHLLKRSNKYEGEMIKLGNINNEKSAWKIDHVHFDF